MDFTRLTTELTATALVGLFSILIMFLWKLPKTLSALSDSINDLNTTIEKQGALLLDVESRMDVHDAMFSDIAGKSVSSHRIARGLDQRPIFTIIKGPVREQ